MRALVVVTLLCLFGCDDFDPTGSYQGSERVSGSVRTMATDVQEDGTFTADTNHITSSQEGAQVQVRRTGERTLQLVLDNGCTLSLTQSEEPNEHSTVVSQDSEQTCRLTVGDYQGPVTIRGTADFGTDTPTLNVMLTGSFADSRDPDRAGHMTGSWEYSYDGSRSAQ